MGIYTRAIRGLAGAVVVPAGTHDYVRDLPNHSEGVLFHPRVGEVCCVCAVCCWNRSVDRVAAALGAPPLVRSYFTLSRWVDGHRPLPLA